MLAGPLLALMQYNRPRNQPTDKINAFMCVSRSQTISFPSTTPTFETSRRGRGRGTCRLGFMEYFWENFLFLYAFNELWWGSLSQTPNSPLPWHRNQHPFRFYWTFFINFRISRNLLPFFSALPGAFRTIQTLSRIVCLNDNFLAFCKRKGSENVL